MWKHDSYLNFYPLLLYLSLQIIPCVTQSKVSKMQGNKELPTWSYPLESKTSEEDEIGTAENTAQVRGVRCYHHRNPIQLWCHIPQFVGQKGIKSIALHAERVTYMPQKCRKTGEKRPSTPSCSWLPHTVHSLLLKLSKMESFLYRHIK